MAIGCPNINSNEFRDLADHFGENIAESLYYRNNGEIPTVEHAKDIIKGDKISQFKRAMKYLDSTTSADPLELVNNFFRIVQKVGDDLYVVKGSAINQTPKPGADSEIHLPNKNFLNSVNTTYGQLFNVEKVTNTSAIQSLGDEILSDLKNGDYDSLLALTYKEYANDPEKRDTILSELSEQAAGGDATNLELQQTLDPAVVDKALRYYQLVRGEKSEGLKENKTGKTQEFFSDVVTGKSEKFKPGKPFEPILPFTTEENKFKTIYDKFKGKFDEHIATSIPTFRELQIKVGNALSDIYKKSGGLIYDIGGSEGGFVKAISEKTEGKVRTINLDANEQMQASHEATPVKGSEFVNQAFLEPYTEGEKTYEKHVPTEKADVVHESMVFQFISPERQQFIDEIKNNYLKSDGVVLLEEKVLPETQEQFANSEKIKDQYKLQYYPQEALTAKAEQVLVGMKQNQTAESELLKVLNGRFNYVGQYWDSGNFKGYIATDSKEKFDAFKSKVGEVTSEYSARKEGELVNFENGTQTTGENLGVKTPRVKPTEGTYKVNINQDALNKIAFDNIAKQSKDLDVQDEALDANKRINEKAIPKYSRAYDAVQVQSVNHNVLETLKRKFNLPYEVVNDPTVDWRGKFEKGKVFINAAKVTEYTPVHEYLHPFVETMKKDNPDLYNNLLDELRNDEQGKKVIEDIKKNYPEITNNEQLDEALVTHISKLVDSDNIKSKPWYQKLIDWIKDIFSKQGTSIANLDLNTRLSDIADKIIDPTYSANLGKYYDFNDLATKYDKESLASTKDFQTHLDKIAERLTLDVNISPVTKEESTRKYYSKQQLEDIKSGDARRVVEAVHDYVKSGIINMREVSKLFNDFKDFYDLKKGKLTQEERRNGMNTLNQIEQHVALYNESRHVVEAIRELDPEEFKGNFRLLATRLNTDAKIINDYQQWGLKLIADELYSHMKKTIDSYVKTGNKEKMPGFDEYVNIKKDNPGISENEAIEKGAKAFLRNQLQHATSDMGFFSSCMSGVLNSNDAVSNLVGLSLKDEFSKNNDNLIRVKKGIAQAYKKAAGTKLFTTNAQNKEFYSKFMRKVQSWERIGVKENGDPEFGYVERDGFHEPYKYDQFSKDKRTMFEKLGVRPNKSDEEEYQKWYDAKEKWFDDNTIAVTNDKGDVIKRIPSDKYKNADFDRIKGDPLFKELYKHYSDANTKLGKYGLKYGIIPQDSLGGGFFSDIRISRGFKGNWDKVKENLKDTLSTELSNYYAQDIDGKEFKNIPIRHTRMLDNEDLSYNLANSVSKFYDSSSKYESATEVRPMVDVLRNFIEGNAFLKIPERTVPQVDARGAKRMGNYVKGILKVKDQSNNNRMLVDFLNDTVYGESEKKANIKSPFLNLRYVIYKAGDTSINGKPRREYVYSLEDLKKKTGQEDLTHDSFEKGKEKTVNGYNITLQRQDKILSVNKIGRGFNTVSSVVTLGGNMLAGTSHYLRGAAANFIEASGGKYFTVPEWGSAYKEYFKNLTNFNFIEDARGVGKGSLVSQLLTHYGTFQGEFVNEFGNNIGTGVVNKLFRRSNLFFSIHGAEHMIQTTQMIAAMKHIKLSDGKGGKVSLFDAWEKGKDGNIKLKDGVAWDKTKDNEFRDLIQSINKDRGNYSEFDKAALNRLWWGKMIIMFRRHIFNGFKTRFGKGQADFERGGAVEGYYRSFMTSLVSQVNELRLNGKLRKLTPDEAYAMKKTVADIGMISTLALVLVPAFRNQDDDDKRKWNDYMALFSRRLQYDMGFYTNPLEWKKILQSPVVTGSTLDKMYDFLHQGITGPYDTYEKDGAGYQAGDSKLVHRMKGVIPGYSTIVNLMDPHDLVKFYDINVPFKKQ